MTDTITVYCKNCGHLKEHHNLDAEDFNSKKRRAEGESACHDNSFDTHHCICNGYQSWV